jgi:hypothetical protein
MAFTQRSIVAVAALGILLAGNPSFGIQEAEPVELAVIAAGAGRLVGTESKAEVSFEPAAAARLDAAGLRAGAFELVQFSLLTRDADPDDPKLNHIGSLLEFRDPLGRRARLVYTPEYTWDGRKVVVRRADVTPFYRLTEDLVPMLAFVPAEARQPDLMKPDAAFGELAGFAQEMALTAEALSAAAPGVRNYDVFALFTERLPPATRIEIRLGASRSGSDGRPLPTWQVDDGGWRVAVGRVSLDLAGGPEQFIQTVVISQADDGAVDEQIVGSLSTRITR